MSTTKDLTVLAAGLSAGLFTEAALLEELGDESLVAQVIALSTGAVLGGVAASLTASALDNEIVTEVTDVIDDVIDSVNPFNW